MKKLSFFFLCYMTVSLLYSQNTFNKHYHFGWAATIGNSIYVTDSCYYFSGLIADTIPPYREGLVFGKLDLEGNIISFNSIFDEDKTYQNWLTPLVFSTVDSSFISMGYGVDSLGRYNYWMKLSEDGIPIQSSTFRAAYFPLETGTRVDDFFQHPASSNYYVLNEAFRGENNLGITQGHNVAVTILNANGDSINNFIYEYSFNYLPQKILLKNNNEIIIGIRKDNGNLTRWDLKLYSKIIAIDTLGQIQWSWQSAHNVVEQGANDIVATEDGGLVVASARGFLEPVNIEAQRIIWDRGLVFKLDSSHQIEWEYEFQLPYYGRSNGLFHIVESIDHSGYIAAGQAYEYYGPGEGAVLGWLTKTSPQGDSLWSRKLFYYEYPDSLEYEHQIHDLQTTPDGGYLMSGQTLDRNQISTPVQQAWFIKVDAEGCLIPGCGLVDAIKPSPEEGPALLLYPNPASDYLNVYLGDNGGKKWSFVVYNDVGQKMGRYAASIGHTTYMIAVDRWPAGQYYLRVVDDAGRILKGYPWVKL